MPDLIVSPSASASPVLVRDVGGYPLPPSEIVERVKRIHPQLNLRFADGIGGTGWAITWEWNETDRRWAWVQDGRTDPTMAYDIIGYLPMGCKVDEAPSYLESSIKQYPREEVQKLRERVSYYNRVEQPKEVVAKVTADAMDDFSRDQRAPKGQIISVGKGRSKRSKS